MFRVTLPLTLLAGALAFAQTEPPRSSHIQLPVIFEQNNGQTDSRVRFLARRGSSTMFFTPDEVVLALHSRSAKEKDKVQTAALRLHFAGGNSRPQVRAEREMSGRVNYLVGSDRAKWRLNVPTYAAVRYREIYPGVDALFYGAEGEIEYDLNVAPGVDVSKVRLSFEGADSIRVAENGDLLLSVGDGEVRQHLPRVYQRVGGKKRVLTARHVLRNDGTVGFSVQGADPRRALVIDPILSYSTYIGSNTGDEVRSVAVDQDGRAYATGLTTYNFPTKNPAQGNQPGVDAFVTKFWATGGGLIYSTIVGSSGWDMGTAIAVDRFGSAYVAGLTDGEDLAPVPGSYQPPPLTTEGGPLGFVVKLSPSGSSLVYSVRIGGAAPHELRALAIDSQQRAYITGDTCALNYPTKNAYQADYPAQPCSSGGASIYLTRFNAAGTDIDFSTYFGGNIAQSGAGIFVDSTFNIYLTGWTSSPGYPTTPGAFQRDFKAASTPSGPHDIPGRTAYVTKLAPGAQSIVYSTFLGGTSDDVANAIAVDSEGRAYVTGSATSSDFPVTAGAFQATRHGPSDVFVTKLWKDGRGLIYSTYLGGSTDESAASVAVDGSGRAMVVGWTHSTNFPVVAPFQGTLRGTQDAFVTRLSPSGKALTFSTFLGGTGDEIANSVRMDSAGNAYIGGTTGSANFPTTSGAYSRTYKGGGNDGWVAKIAP